MTAEPLGVGEAYVGQEKYQSNLAMFEKLAENKEIGDSASAEKLRHEIIEANKNLAYWIANHFSESAEVEKGDIQSFAFEGLIYAVDNFDYKMGYRFSTYAHPCIIGIILSGISKSRAVSGLDTNAYRSLRKATESSEGYSGYINETYPKRREIIIKRLVKNNKNNSSYFPTEAEIAEEFANETSKLIELYSKIEQGTVSLDAPKEVYSFENQGVINVDQDVIDKNSTNDPVEVAHQAIMAEAVSQVLETLGPNEKLVIALRYGLSQLVEEYAKKLNDEEFNTKLAMAYETQKPRQVSSPEAPDGFTLEAIGELLNLSSNRVWQIERKAFRKLSHPGRNRRLLDYE